jgi:hypothetical protein
VACEAIAELPALTRLNAEVCTQLQDRAFAALARSHTLTELNVEGCGELGTFVGLGASCSLQRLNAANTFYRPSPGEDVLRMQTALVAQLARCSTLTYLDLSRTVGDHDVLRIHFDALRALSVCSALETLVLTAPLDNNDLAALQRLIAALRRLGRLKLFVPDDIAFPQAESAAELLANLRAFRDDSQMRRRSTALRQQGESSAYVQAEKGAEMLAKLRAFRDDSEVRRRSAVLQQSESPLYVQLYRLGDVRRIAAEESVMHSDATSLVL